MSRTLEHAETLSAIYNVLSYKEMEIASLLTEIERLEKDIKRKKQIIAELDRIRLNKGKEVEQLIEVLKTMNKIMKSLYFKLNEENPEHQVIIRFFDKVKSQGCNKVDVL